MKTGKLKVKQPSQLQEILNVARSLIDETVLLSVETLPTLETKTKLQQLKNVLEMYGHFSGINRKVQFKYQAKGKSKSSSSEDGKLDSSMQIKTWPTSLLGIVNLLQIKMKMTVRRRCC
jgi:inositol hexakisphosphate/diphosphoinositol-pentakisphosphate kinase